MKGHDFSKGKRGPVLLQQPGKERITTRLDSDILEYFRKQAEAAGGGNYQAAINAVLREHREGQRAPQIEEIVRRVIREELRKGS